MKERNIEEMKWKVKKENNQKIKKEIKKIINISKIWKAENNRK